MCLHTQPIHYKTFYIHYIHTKEHSKMFMFGGYFMWNENVKFSVLRLHCNHQWLIQGFHFLVCCENKSSYISWVHQYSQKQKHQNILACAKMNDLMFGLFDKQ